MTPYVFGVAGIAVILATLIDAFEVVLLPRPVRSRLRLNRYFFVRTWNLWSLFASRLSEGIRKENFIGIYGPLSMVMLFSLWALCLIIGFGLLQWALQPTELGGLAQALGRKMLMSGDAFFTLGYGDIVPTNPVARALAIVECGTGFGFIAVTVGYLPVLYQHFSARDVELIEFGARAGTPPTAGALLRWHAASGNASQLSDWLREWEHWAGELIESHSTYPMLAFYRSQHEGHSWLASLAVILDTCALLLAGSDRGLTLQAAATFAAARRVLNEISNSLDVPPARWTGIRTLSSQDFLHLAPVLKSSVPGWHDGPKTAELMVQIQRTYEPLLGGLSAYLLLPLPRWADGSSHDSDSLGTTSVVQSLLRHADLRD